MTSGVLLQFVFGAFVLRWETGKQVFACLGDRVAVFLSYANEGAAFVYGYLASGKSKDISLGTIFAFRVGPYHC